MPSGGWSPEVISAVAFSIGSILLVVIPLVYCISTDIWKNLRRRNSAGATERQENELENNRESNEVSHATIDQRPCTTTVQCSISAKMARKEFFIFIIFSDKYTCSDIV